MYDSSAYWQAKLMEWGPRILIALLIIVATWIVARAVKWMIQKAIDRTSGAAQAVTGKPGETVGYQIGVMPSSLSGWSESWQRCAFSGLARSSPQSTTLTMEIFAFLPRLIGAGLLFFIGLILARIVKQLIEALLIAANVDGLLARIGIGDTAGTVRTEPAAVPPGRRPARPGRASPVPPKS